MRVNLVALFMLGVAAAALAQISAVKPAFEVASVRINTATEGTQVMGDQPGGRFVATRVLLRRVIQFAYRGNQDFVGGPDWLDTDRWDIEARAPEGTIFVRENPLDIAKPDTLALMLQSLLEERFKMQSHQETRELPLYNLTVAKGGSKLKLSDDQSPPPAVIATGNSASEVARGGIRLGRSSLEAQAQSIDLLAAALGALYADRPVVNRTGLKGLYDIRLQWALRTVNPAAAQGTAPSAPLGPTLFDALEEQLGLKLEAGKGQLPVLVIESIQRPSEN